MHERHPPEDAQEGVFKVNKLMNTVPLEVTIKIHDASVEKPDNWRDVIIDGERNGSCVAFWNDEKWIGSAGVISWSVRWWADFPKVQIE